MSKTLQIVTLQGEAESWSWRFGPGITVLVGPVGVGKSSLLELIKYGLGGRASLTRAVRNTGHRVLVAITLRDRDVVLVRGIASDTQAVQVLDRAHGSLGRFAIAPDGETTTISDFILESLDIPRLTVPRSQARPTDRYTRISFNDVFAYMYLDQTEIDRSTIHHLDYARDVKRRQTFEMLYRLIDTATARLKVELADTETERARVAQRTEIIGEFLRSSGVPSATALEQHMKALVAEEAMVRAELDHLTEAARRASTVADDQRVTAQVLEARVDAARKEHTSTVAEAEGFRSVQAQLLLDHDRTVKAMVAGEVFTAFEFRSCPRCLQSIARPASAETCVVCMQPEPPVVDGVALDDERQRLEAQLAETDELLEEATSRVRAVEDQIAQDTAELTAARDAIDRLAAEAVAPFADAQARVHERLGSLTAQLEALDAQRRVSEELHALETTVKQLNAEADELRSALEAAQADLEAGRERVADLSDIFAEIVAGLQLPWASHATIDPNDYLPRIDGDRLERLGSGGMKALVNIAYFLANLTWSLREPTALLPRLLIIDSPRKDHGAGAEDLEAADRIYGWMLRLLNMMRTPRTAGAGRPFQLIIADNDVPDEVRPHVGVLELGYDTPLISDASIDEPQSE